MNRPEDHSNMHQNIIQALQTLYGSAANPVCAVDRSLRVVWQNRADAEKLVRQISLHTLTGSESPYTPPLSAESTFFVRTEKQRMRCTVQPLSFGNAAYYLLFFEPVSGGAAMTAAELRTVLERQADVCRELAAMLVHTVRNTAGETDEVGLPLDAAARQSYLQMQVIVYSLMRRSLSCSELLWYENFAGAQRSGITVQNIGTMMRRLSNQIAVISGGWLEVRGDDIAQKLYAPIDSKRLTYVLLVLVSAAIAKYAVSGVFSCKAYQQEEQIRIEMCFAPHAAGTARDIPPRYSMVQPDTAGDQTIIRRFCDAFDVEITERVVPGCTAHVISIPALTAGSSCNILRSDRETYGKTDRFSVSHILLSDILPTETFFETEADLF